MNNKIRIEVPEKLVSKYYYPTEEEEIDETFENKSNESEGSFDGFESYNLMRKYQESLLKLDEAFEEPAEDEQGSFEFDLQPEDIYDLTMF